MIYTQETLDKPFSDLEEDNSNTETVREYIRASESEFGLEEVALETLSDEKLTEYVQWLDYLWTK